MSRPQMSRLRFRKGGCGVSWEILVLGKQVQLHPEKSNAIILEGIYLG